MRIIVACTGCRRQYDASGRSIGERFACRCGADVTVAQPRGHDAAIVRCSSCGAARRNESAHCEHCAGDFTLHEQDLHTVCPRCLARVSDRARYCHHCATLLVAEAIVAEPTPFECPVCHPKCQLTTRQLRDSQLPIMECQRCGGFWVGQHIFERLIDHEIREPKRVAAPRERPRLPERTAYRPCAVCGKLMVRWNFGRSSGVLVDVCGAHGIWFDAQELAHVMRWIRSGNLHKAQGDLVRLRRTSVASESWRPLTERKRAPAAWTDGDDDRIIEWLASLDGVSTIATTIGRFFQLR